MADEEIFHLAAVVDHSASRVRAGNTPAAAPGFHRGAIMPRLTPLGLWHTVAADLMFSLRKAALRTRGKNAVKETRLHTSPQTFSWRES
jgi:hypothetical protein